MADVHADNQHIEAVTTLTGSELKEEIEIAAHDDDVASERASDNQQIHDDDAAVDETHVDASVETDDEDGERRLTWIGEGLLDGEGLEAVQQLMNLPPSPQKPAPEIATKADSRTDKETEQPPARVERSGSRLLDFLAKEEGFKPDVKPKVAAMTPPRPPAKPVAPSGGREKRQNKLLDFLASDVGERYLDGLYQEDSSDEGSRHDATTPEETKDNQAAGSANVQNNRLQAFLARERGERVHEVEKTVGDNEPRRPEPYRVSISIVTPETVAEVLASEETARSVSPEPTPEVTRVAVAENTDNTFDVSPSADRSKLVEFIKNVQPPSRPKFVLFNPEDLVSSSGSETEDGSSPTGNPKDFRLKRSKQDASRVRFANPGLDMQSGVVRQAVTDHYGREELLDFMAEVDMSPALSRSQRSANSHESSRSSFRREPIAPIPHGSPPVGKDSSSLPASTRKHDGRLVTFLRKFSSKSKEGSDSGSSHHGSRSNSPNLSIRYSASPSAQKPQPEAQFAPFEPSGPFVVRSTTEAEPGSASQVEEKQTANRSSLGHRSSESDPASKRSVLLMSLRQLLEDCEKNELSDISMVRVSILLSTVNQIVRDDVQKERPAQGIMRRMSMHVSQATPAGASDGPAAPWVRSNKEQEEYERGHSTTTSDIAHHVERKSQSPRARPPSPLLSLHPVDEPVTDDAMTAFRGFETAQNMPEIIHAFDRLLASCSISEAAARTPLHVYNHVKSALYNHFSFRQKQLFRLLDVKLSVDVYKRQPCLHKRVCVVGAGPVGLRAAVELALLGGQVVVIEKRKLFNRENILHLWPWVVQDLTSLGAKVFFPQFCHSSAYFHVGTRQMQCILLKVALLLGVKMYPGTSFEGIASPDAIVSDRKPFYSVATKPQMPWQEFTAVLGACGTKDKLNAHAGIKRFVFSRKEAIGLVCYFPNLGTNEEKKVNEFSWTIQFKQRLFAKMRDMGVDLENVVYYRGEYHYIVMTPKRTNLIQQGVLKINYPSVSDLVAVDNIDPGALNDYVSRIINFFEIPQKSEFARVRLFDFSTRTRAAQAANVLTSRGKKLYVGLIGDALMEPFWPEGLGICRGFLGAMDACWMISQIGKLSDEQILADRELGYRIVQHISGFQRDDLQKNVRKYNVDPSSRYTIQYPATMSY